MVRPQPADGRCSGGGNAAHRRRAGQTAGSRQGAVRPATAQPPALPLLAGQPALAHEAEWVPNPDGGATPALYSAYFRPNADYPSQIVGVAWMNQALTSTHLFAGTAEPVPGTTPAAAQVPHDLRSRLVAVFNSGWKMADSRGGFYAGGKSLVPLQDGAASLVIDRRGGSRSASGAATSGSGQTSPPSARTCN